MLSGFITSLSELVALIFQTFRPPALLPAMMFVLANEILVLPNLKGTSIGILFYSRDQSAQVLILAVIVALVTYLLTVLNFSFIRFFEGYPLLGWPFQWGRV